MSDLEKLAKLIVEMNTIGYKMSETTWRPARADELL